MGQIAKDEARQVGVGLLFGLIGVLFGLAWVVYLTANHEGIHDYLSRSAKAAAIEKAAPVSMDAAPEPKAAHKDGHSHSHGGHAKAPGNSGAGYGNADEAEASGHAHSSGLMELAHERLAKAHAHAMGLGMLSIAVSLTLAFIPASPRLRTVAAASIGAGGLLYPFSWLIMGLRTPSLGASGAEASAMPIIGLSVLLVGAGLVLALVLVARWLLSRA